MNPKPNHSCLLCGGPNECNPARSGSFETPCWCREVKIDPRVIARIPEAKRKQSCICPKCAASSS